MLSRARDTAARHGNRSPYRSLRSSRIGLVVFDFVIFAVHVGLHRYDVLWNVHKVHHSIVAPRRLRHHPHAHDREHAAVRTRTSRTVPHRHARRRSSPRQSRSPPLRRVRTTAISASTCAGSKRSSSLHVCTDATTSPDDPEQLRRDAAPCGTGSSEHSCDARRCPTSATACPVRSKRTRRISRGLPPPTTGGKANAGLGWAT